MAMTKCDKCGNYYSETCQTCEFGGLKPTVDWMGLDVRPSENAGLGIENADDY